jgi:hypothetical protein
MYLEFGGADYMPHGNDQHVALARAQEGTQVTCTNMNLEIRES